MTNIALVGDHRDLMKVGSPDIVDTEGDYGQGMNHVLRLYMVGECEKYQV